MSVSPTDEELFAAYVRGDVVAFDVLFRRYAPSLLGLFRRDIYRPQDAEELVQETFLRAHRAAADFRLDAPLKPWLITIALNVKRSYKRRKARKPEAPLELDGRRDPSVESTYENRRDARVQVSAGLAQLPPKQREVIELHWFGGLSMAEVADAVGASLSAVKVRAHRGYKSMRVAIEASSNQSEIVGVPPTRGPRT